MIGNSVFAFGTPQLILGVASALVIGISKTGISGVSILFVPLMAAAFGAKESTGVILPMLLVGDVIAVTYYRRHVDWKNLLRLLPWAIAGLMAGVLVGQHVSNQEFKRILAIIVFVLLGLMVWQDMQKTERTYPGAWWFAALSGLLAGFTTMVGNAAGPVMTIYLLSMRLSKTSFIGTSAWFFFILNVCKVPLQVFFWKNIGPASLSFDLLMIPAIAIGSFAGVKLVGKIPEKAFRILVMVMTAITALFLLF